MTKRRTVGSTRTRNNAISGAHIYLTESDINETAWCECAHSEQHHFVNDRAKPCSACECRDFRPLPPHTKHDYPGIRIRQVKPYLTPDEARRLWKKHDKAVEQMDTSPADTEKCPRCNGSGERDAGEDDGGCPVCRGRGEVMR